MIRERLFAGILPCALALGLSACAHGRWVEQWRRMPSALRDVSTDRSPAPNLEVMGNRGMRFGERLAVLSQTVTVPMDEVLRGRSAVRVQCRSAADECFGFLLSDGESVRLHLVLRNLTIRLAFASPLLLETENGEAVISVGPFRDVFDLDTGRVGIGHFDGAAASCVAAEAFVLSRSELRRVEHDMSRGKVNEHERNQMDETLVRLGDHPARLCRF